MSVHCQALSCALEEPLKSSTVSNSQDVLLSLFKTIVFTLVA